jgi:hypothetical protein
MRKDANLRRFYRQFRGRKERQKVLKWRRDEKLSGSGIEDR